MALIELSVYNETSVLNDVFYELKGEKQKRLLMQYITNPSLFESSNIWGLLGFSGLWA